MVLIRSSAMGGDCRTSLLLKVRNAGMQGQKFLYSLRVLEADLTSLLLLGGPMGLLHQSVAARRPNDLDVLHSVEHRKGSNGRSAAPEFIGVNDVWNLVIHQQFPRKVFAAWASR